MANKESQIVGAEEFSLLPQLPSPTPQGFALYARTLPAGMVIMWAGKGPLPAGWLVCDGTHGTPDLRGRLPCGVPATGRVDVNTPMDAQQITLELAQLPSHTHVASLPLKKADYTYWGRGDEGKTEIGETLNATDFDWKLMHPETRSDTNAKSGSGTSVYDRYGREDSRTVREVLEQVKVKVESTEKAAPFAVPLPVRTYVHFLMKA